MGPGGMGGYWDSLIPSGPTSELPGIGEGGDGGNPSLGGDFGGGGGGVVDTSLELPAGIAGQMGQLLQSAYGQAASLPEGQALAYFLGQLYAQWQRDRDNAMVINRLLASILAFNQCKQISTQQVNKNAKIPAAQKPVAIRKATIKCTVATLTALDQRLRALAREMLVPVAQALLQALFGR